MFDQPNAPYDSKFCNQSGIYRLDVGPKFYLGSTTRLGSRHSSHRADLAAGKHPNKALQAAWDEHQDFRFTILTLIPAKDCDEGRDHTERLKFHEQVLLDRLFSDPGCCNASESSRYNTGISEAMKAKWLDPEFRVAAVRRLRECRKTNPATPETRAKMSRAKLGSRNPHSRKCWLEVPGAPRVVYSCVTTAAAAIGVKQQILHSWLTGGSSWPGSGSRKPRPANRHLTGLTGGYVDKNPTRSPYLDRSKKLIEVELKFGDGPAERFPTIHAAARRAKTRHLKMYQWLAGERPWPDGLTGRAITPL